jgi:uncharacterized protein
MQVETPPRALITGASSGIGAAFARVLRRRGRRLIVVSRRASRLEALAQELGGKEFVQVITLDLAVPGAGTELKTQVVSQLGLTVDLLVNNAGVGFHGKFAESSPSALVGMIDLNTRALVEITRAFLPPMLERRSGAVINVASMSSFQPVPYLGVYAASKAFVLSFTESLAVELKSTGVRVQALCPGNVPTEFQELAGTSNVPYSSSPTTSPNQVAEISLEALDRGKRVVVIPSRRDRITVAAERLVPRSTAIRAAGRLFKPQQ